MSDFFESGSLGLLKVRIDAGEAISIPDVFKYARGKVRFAHANNETIREVINEVLDCLGISYEYCADEDFYETMDGYFVIENFDAMFHEWTITYYHDLGGYESVVLCGESLEERNN